MAWIIIALIVSLITAGGDYFIKRAGADPSKFVIWQFLFLGSLLYVLTGIGWFFVMKHIKLTSVGVIYGVSTVLFISMLGIFIFHERLNWYEIVGVIMAVSSIILLARFA